MRENNLPTNLSKAFAKYSRQILFVKTADRYSLQTDHEFKNDIFKSCDYHEVVPYSSPILSPKKGNLEGDWRYCIRI